MKKLTKLFSVILCVCFCCALFFGCDIVNGLFGTKTASYWYSLNDKNFKPATKTPDKLSEETENKIKDACLIQFVAYCGKGISASDICIEYLGTYDDCVAIWAFVEYNDWYNNSEYEVIIDGVSFLLDKNNIEANIFIYQAETIYDLQDAYDSGMLTKEDLKNIAYYKNENLVLPERTARKPRDEKSIWNGNIDQDFDDKNILMVMDKSYTGWRFLAEDFKGVNVVVVEGLMVLRLMNPDSHFVDRSNFRDIILIEIANPGKQNVIDAIRELEKLPFVKSAGPNYYYHLD